MIVTTPRKYTNQKPRIGSRIDVTSALSRGLVFALPLWEGAGTPTDVAQRNTAAVQSVPWVNDELSFTQGTTNVADFGPALTYQPTGTMTVHCSVFVANLTGQSIMLTRDGGSAAVTGFSFFLTPTGQFNASLWIFSGPTACIVSGITAGSYYDLTLTFDGATMTFYVRDATGNTTVVTAGGATLTASSSGDHLLFGNDKHIGGSGTNTRSFGGRIRHAYIWNRCLSPSEVAQLHNEPYSMFAAPSLTRFARRASPYTWPTQQFNQGALFGETAVRHPTTFARRTITETLFSEGLPANQTHARQNIDEGPLFTQTMTRGPMTYAPRVFIEPLFPERLAIPVVIVEPVLFSQVLARGSITYQPRVLPTPLFNQSVSIGVKSWQRRTITNTLFSQSVRVGPVYRAVPSGDYDPADPFQYSLSWQALLYSIRSKPLNASKLLIILDGLAASFRQADLAAASARVAATQVNVVGGDGSSSTVYGTGDEAFILKVAPAIDAAALALIPDTVNKQAYSIPMSAIADWLHTADGGNFASLDAYATAQNAASYGSWLSAPSLAYIYFLYNAKNLMMSPGNVFAPATTFGTATVGGGGAIAFTPASTIATANNVLAGIQGYVPAPSVTAAITVPTNGSLLISVTGNGVSATGTPFTGHTWTGTLSSLAAGAVVTLTPTVAGDRISAITACASTGTPTATTGAFTLASVLERVIS